MKRSLRQNYLAGQERFGNLARQPDRPVMMPIAAIRECDEKTSIRDGLHWRENPDPERRTRLQQAA